MDPNILTIHLLLVTFLTCFENSGAVEGSPDPDNPFKINITHGQTPGIWKSIEQCQSDYKQCLIGLDNEEIKNSFLDILRSNDDKQHYYINAWREDAKSPYVWVGVNITADNKYWGSGKPSEKDNEKCAKVWYDPTSDGLNWASATCNEKNYKACQGEEDTCGKRDTCFDDQNFLKSLYFSKDKGNVEFAEKKCADMEMRLVIVDEQYKHDALKCILAAKHDISQYHMGGRRISKDGEQGENAEFRWLNGERLSYRHFGKDRPDNIRRFKKPPYTHLSLKYNEKDLLWWDIDTVSKYKYICEPPRENYVKGSPDPENPFEIYFSHYKIGGIEKISEECKIKYNKKIISIETEEIKKSFMNMLIQNDDKKFYYINVIRNDSKSPFMWYNTTIKADDKFWGSGSPSEAENHLCALVAYDPNLGDLKWTSNSCRGTFYIACQGEIKPDETEASSDKTPNCTSAGTGASGNAEACSGAGASESAEVSDNAEVSDSAEVSDGAEVSDEAEVSDGAEVNGGADVSGGAEVSGGEEVSGDAGVSGSAGVSGDAEDNSGAEVSGNAGVSGDSEANGEAGISGNPKLSGDAEANGGASGYAGGNVSAGSSGKPRRPCYKAKKPTGP